VTYLFCRVLLLFFLLLLSFPGHFSLLPFFSITLSLPVFFSSCYLFSHYNVYTDTYIRIYKNLVCTYVLYIFQLCEICICVRIADHSMIYRLVLLFSLCLSVTILLFCKGHYCETYCAKLNYRHVGQKILREQNEN